MVTDKMKLSALTLLTTVALFQSVYGKEYHVYTIGRDRASPDDATAPPNTTDALTDYYLSGYIDTHRALFKDRSKIPTKVFRAMTGRGANTLVRYAAMLEKQEVSPSSWGSKNKEEFKKFVKGINEERLRACTNEHCTMLLSFIYSNGFGDQVKSDFLTGAQVKSIADSMLKPKPWGCLDANPNPDPSGPGKQPTLDATCLKNSFEKISKTALTTNAVQLVRSAKDALHLFSVNVLKPVLSVPAACEEIHPVSLAEILKDSAKSALLNAECFAAIDPKDFPTYDPADKSTFKLPNDAFKFYDKKVEPVFLKRFNDLQVQNFAAGITNEGDMPGKGLDIAEMDKARMKSLKKAILLGRLHYMKSHPSPGDSPAPIFPPKSGKLGFSPDIFRDIKSEDAMTALESLSAADLNALGANVIEHIMNHYPAVCHNLDSAIDYKTISLTNPLCFRYLPANVQGHVIATCKAIPDDAFDHATVEDVAGWRATVATGGGKELSGVEVLSAKDRPNLARLIAGFGRAPDGTDPCTEMPEIADMPVRLATHITAKCFNAKKGGRTIPDEFPKGLERLAYMVPFAELKKAKPETFWTKMTDKTFGILTTTGSFCGEVDKATFDKIPLAALASMNGECMEGVSRHIEMSKEQVHACPNNVFASLNSDQITPAMIMHMKKEQLLGACTKAPDATKNNVAVNFTKDIMAAIDPAILTDAHWEGVPPAAFQGISKVAGIDPINMVHWNLNQVKEAPAAAFKDLSVDQAKEIGSKAKVDESPVKHLAGLEEIHDDVRAVLKARLAPIDIPESEGMPTWAWFVIGGVVVIIGGGGAYFFVKRQ